jgi:hypothetical protein
MFIINKDLFDKLPEEVRNMVAEQGTSIEDEEVSAKIEALAGMVEPEGTEIEEVVAEDGDEFNGEKIQYGKEGEFEAEINEDGHMKDMPESERSKITDFDDAAERGMDLLSALDNKAEKKAATQHKVNKIPTKKDEKEVEVKQ